MVLHVRFETDAQPRGWAFSFPTGEFCMTTIGSPLLWGAFAALVVVALLVDLVLMRHGGPHKVTFKEAVFWSIGWIGLALAFNAGLWWYVGQQAGEVVGNRVALEFLTGYLVEKSLAVDNIFVFLMVFTFFSVPEEQRQKVLIIGVLGAIVLRAIMIFAGAFLLAKFHWILYVFGAFLLLTGIKMMLAAGKAPDLEKNPVLKWMRGHLPLTSDYHGNLLSVLKEGKRWYTPLFVVIVLIGVTDLIFAVDSIPAIFAITGDPFIVLTSNVFAVLGLRAMFFLLAGMADRFHLLPYGLALVLMFIGAKMLLIDVYKIPILVSLGVVAATIGATVVLSLVRPARPPAVS
jgi:tellurite resistance protein TerC